MGNNFRKRIISGLVYGLVVFLCTTRFGSTLIFEIFMVSVNQSYLYYGLITCFVILSVYECIKITKMKSLIFLIITIFFGGYIYYRFSYKFFHQYFYVGINIMDVFGIILIAIAMITVFKFPKEIKNNRGKVIFTVLYVTIPFGFSLGLPDFFSYNRYFSCEVFMLFVLIWSSDSFAYFAGSLFGKHKMVPTVSSKKTWEGFTGGFICTLILSYFIQYKFPEMKGNWIVVGGLVSIFAPLGDLVESQFKRIFNFKDSGTIIPGHGGILDRLDSFILCAPVVYTYFMILTRF